MKLTITIHNAIVIVKIAGDVDSRTVGRLYDSLVQCIGGGNRKLIVDLSAVDLITRAGARGLIVAAKLLEASRGQMRICGADGSTTNVLKGFGFNHLLKVDTTLASSLDKLSDAEKMIERDYTSISFGNPVTTRFFPVKAAANGNSKVTWNWELN